MARVLSCRAWPRNRQSSTTVPPRQASSGAAGAASFSQVIRARADDRAGAGLHLGRCRHSGGRTGMIADDQLAALTARFVVQDLSTRGVLLVDDEPLNLKVLSSFLEDDYKVSRPPPAPRRSRWRRRRRSTW